MKQGSNNNKVLGKKDIFVLSFGAMIGWGWVVLSGGWIKEAGTLGAIAAFVIGGVMALFVGQIYAELTTAVPDNGGCFFFSQRGLGEKAAFICTWAIIFGYISVIAFEAVAFPTVLQYLFPNYLKGFLYQVNGFDVYFTWVIVGIISSVVIAVMNYLGMKHAARIQIVLTALVILVGISFVAGSAVNGDAANMQPLFRDGVTGVMAVLVVTPFLFVGFDVIPQVAGETNVPLKTLGKILLLSIVMAVVWYGMIIFGVSMSMKETALISSQLVAADAIQNAFLGNSFASKILIFGGIAGIITSWNTFYVGASRAICTLAQNGLLPAFLGKIHPKYKTPSNAILLIGAVTVLVPWFGQNSLSWLANAGALSIIVSYMIVCLSFLSLRREEPDLLRPYKVKHPKIVGAGAVTLCFLLGLMYMPGAPAALSVYEWIIMIVWCGLGAALYFWASHSRIVHERDKVRQRQKDQAVFYSEIYVIRDDSKQEPMDKNISNFC